MTEGKKTCMVCKKAKAVTKCSGCEMLLCEKCAYLELFGYGCGTVIPTYYCPSCARDSNINPNAVFLQ